nr:protein argonaute 1-like [Tanacetum cinerariifolium]
MACYDVQAQINTYCSKQLRETIITLRLCNALKSKHEENEAIFLRFRLLARHVMTSKLKINTYCSKQLRETIITLSNEQLVKLYKESHLAKCLIAYNERKSINTVVPLPSVSHDFKITLLDDDDGIGSGRFSYLLV